MNYTIYIADHDYGNLFLDKSGNKYIVGAYISGFGLTKREEFDNYDDAEKRYFEMCENSHVTPTKIEHDFSELYALID